LQKGDQSLNIDTGKENRVLFAYRPCHIKRLSLCERADAITPNIGSPTPVIKNPIVALRLLAPASWPICTGNIILPAPKNNPNRSAAINIFNLKVNFSPFSSVLYLYFYFTIYLNLL